MPPSKPPPAPEPPAGTPPGDLWTLLRCPETGQPLSPAPGETIERLNRRVTDGTLRNRAGQPVLEAVEGGWIRADRRWLYPTRRQIAILLIGEAIAVPTE